MDDLTRVVNQLYLQSQGQSIQTSYVIIKHKTGSINNHYLPVYVQSVDDLKSYLISNNYFDIINDKLFVRRYTPNPRVLSGIVESTLEPLNDHFKLSNLKHTDIVEVHHKSDKDIYYSLRLSLDKDMDQKIRQLFSQTNVLKDELLAVKAREDSNDKVIQELRQELAAVRTANDEIEARYREAANDLLDDVRDINANRKPNISISPQKCRKLLAKYRTKSVGHDSSAATAPVMTGNNNSDTESSTANDIDTTRGDIVSVIDVLGQQMTELNNTRKSLEAMASDSNSNSTDKLYDLLSRFSNELHLFSNDLSFKTALIARKIEKSKQQNN